MSENQELSIRAVDEINRLANRISQFAVTQIMMSSKEIITFFGVHTTALCVTTAMLKLMEEIMRREGVEFDDEGSNVATVFADALPKAYLVLRKDVAVNKEQFDKIS